MSILKHFPYELYSEMRDAQRDALLKLECTTKRFVFLQAPVATGKSAIAITYLRSKESGYVVTPRKFLQDQYAQDFKAIPILKGKNAYSCAKPTVGFAPHCGNCSLPPAEKNALYDAVVKKGDTSYNRGGCCPYFKALGDTVHSAHAICNFHSLYFNTVGMPNPRLEPRDLLFIDEAHDLETLLRDTNSLTLKFYGSIGDTSEVMTQGADDWIDFLTPFVVEQGKQRFLDITGQLVSPTEDEVPYINENDLSGFLSKKIEEMDAIKYMGGFVVKVEVLSTQMTHVTFVPKTIAHYAQKFFDLGKQVVLASGTLFDIPNFCRVLGIKECDWIEVDSVIPPAKKPVYLSEALMVDCSFKAWDKNLNSVVKSIETILGKVKATSRGVIHTSSYAMAKQLYELLKHTGRVVTHTGSDFQEIFEYFRKTEGMVLITPSCTQGVDFKDELARFQIIVRLPYPSAQDAFNSYKYETDFSWVNRQALVTLGQQLGRINRHENDVGVTFLLDSRFKSFIEKNKKILPSYVMDSIRY